MGIFLMATKTNEIVFTVTHAGKNAALNAEEIGLILRLQTVGFGIGHGDSNQNSENLVNKVLETELSAGGVQPTTNTLMLGINYTPPQDLYLSEIGIYTEDGVLFAIAQKTEGHFFIFSEGIPFIGSFGLTLGDLDKNKIEITVMQDAPIAQQMIFAHEAHPDPHPQYILKQNIMPYLNSLAKVIWHVGSWHGSDDLNYDPSTALEPIFGYKTNWELKPYIPYGVTNLSDAILREYKVQEGGSLIAHTTRLWKRLHDDFKCVISVDQTLLFQKDKAVFTFTAESVPDYTTVLYQIVGNGIVAKDFRELEKPNTLQGQIVFIDNKAELTLTRNSIESVSGEWFSDPDFVDARDFKLKLIGVDAESPKVTLPVVYAGLSELAFSSNGDGTGVNTYFVIATRGIPVGTKATVSHALNEAPITQEITIDASGRYILEIPKSNIDFSIPNSETPAEKKQFTVVFEMLGKKWWDTGTAYRVSNTHTEMRFGAPTMQLSQSSLTGGFVQIVEDREFHDRALAYTATSAGSLPGKPVLASHNYVMADNNETNNVIVHRKQKGSIKGQFAVHLIGTYVETSDIFGDFIPYARLLVYVD